MGNPMVIQDFSDFLGSPRILLTMSDSIFGAEREYDGEPCSLRQRKSLT